MICYWSYREKKISRPGKVFPVKRDKRFLGGWGDLGCCVWCVGSWVRLFYVSVARSGNSFTRLWRSVTPLSMCSLKRASWSMSGCVFQ